ncbi:hypothetical protein [Aerosakkonema funiforme]|uniref:Uncharacterized protein n=2 Tax=Oscillatoriophycideae TaxID=1301283 RepID=A0A926VBR6_9CYAN|nr:hypothetical protein [Aerosakkonema funiforme]MBD2180630.1 hypothetical protein [Aerosakkonema funiforme FACHB-1375]
MKIKWTRVVLVISILVLSVKKGWLSVPSIPSIPNLLSKALIGVSLKHQTNKPQLVRVNTNLTDEDIWSEVSISKQDPAVKKAPQCNTPKDKFSSLMYVQGLGGNYCRETVNQDRNKL